LGILLDFLVSHRALQLLWLWQRLLLFLDDLLLAGVSSQVLDHLYPFITGCMGIEWLLELLGSRLLLWHGFFGWTHYSLTPSPLFKLPYNVSQIWIGLELLFSRFLA